MATITFENGKTANFEGNPTPSDIDFVAKQMGIQPGTAAPIKSPMQGFNEMNSTLNEASKDYVSGLGNTYAGAVGLNPETGQYSAPDFIKAAESGNNVSEGILRGVGSVANVIFAPITQAVSSLANVYADNPTFQSLATGALSKLSDAGQAIQNVEEANPEAMKDITAGMNILPFLFPEASGLTKDVMKPGPKFVGKTSQIESLTPEYKAAQEALDVQTKNQGIIEDAVRNTAAKYGVSRNLLYNMENRNGTDPLGVISSYGTKAIPEVEPGRGVVNPLESIGFLNEQISNLSEVKREVMETSDKPTQLVEIQRQVNQIIRQQGWTKLQADRAMAEIGDIESAQGEIGALATSYPDGNIPLKEIDKLKTYEANLSKSYNNKTAGPFELDARAVLAKALRQIVENKTDSEIIKEYNKYIQSHYDAIELLKSFENKTPHGGMLTKQFQRIGAEAAGGLAGTVFGGGPKMGIVGAATAGTLSDTVMGIFNDHFISNPLKRALISDMPDIPNPVKQKMLDYLDSLQKQKVQMRLSAPQAGAKRSVIGSGRTIPVIPPGRNIEMPFEPTIVQNQNSLQSFIPNNAESTPLANSTTATAMTTPMTTSIKKIIP